MFIRGSASFELTRGETLVEEHAATFCLINL